MLLTGKFNGSFLVVYFVIGQRIDLAKHFGLIVALQEAASFNPKGFIIRGA